MDIWGFILGLIIFSTLLTVSLIALSVWGVAKGVKAIARHVRGELPSREQNSGPSRPDGTYSQPRRSQAGQPRQTSASRSRSYEYLDVDAGATPERIAEVMQGYVGDAVVGSYAQDVIDALDTVEFRKRSLYAEINNKFSDRSISWSRFMGTADSAIDAVTRNCALLANRVQSFDVVEYGRLERFFSTGGHSGNDEADKARLQRWKLLDETRREMDDIRATNDGLLLELGKLAAELGKLTTNATQDSSADIAEEVSRLVDETKYYR